MALVDIATKFGLTMLNDGWTWTETSRSATRFDWSARTAADDREVRYGFWIESMDETHKKFVVQLVDSAARNLTLTEPRPPFDQPEDVVRMLGVDRVLTACFEPALTIAVVLSNHRAGLGPPPSEIGARGAP